MPPCRRSLLDLAMIMVIVDLVVGIDLEPLLEADEGLPYRKVSHYYMVKEDSGVLLKCTIAKTFEMRQNESAEAIVISRKFLWTFTSMDDAEATLDHGEGRVKGDEVTKCGIFRDYLQKNKGRKLAEVSCQSSLILNNMFDKNVGSYSCRASLNVTIGDRLLATGSVDDEVSIFLDSRPASLFIVTGIVLTAVAFILVAGCCCRMAGHRFAWEYQDPVGQEEVAMGYKSAQMSRISSIDDAIWFARNSRHMSNASNMSGLVLQTDSEGMARLFERLDHMEDVASETSAEEAAEAEGEEMSKSYKVENIAQDQDEKTTDHSNKDSQKSEEEDDEEVKALTLDLDKDRKEENKDGPGKKTSKQTSPVNSPSQSLSPRLKKNYSLFLLPSATAGGTTVAAAMAAGGAQPPPHSGSPRVMTPLGGDHRLVIPPMHRHSPIARHRLNSEGDSDCKRRRSMVGVLPSGIGIGAGAVVASADDLILEQLAAIERERKQAFGNSPGGHHGGANSGVGSGSAVGHHHHKQRRTSLENNVIMEEENSSPDQSINSSKNQMSAK